jgi:hypothetical protein
LDEVHKVYVNADNNATLLCPHCGMSKTGNVEKLKNRGQPLKIRCTCKETFSVTFEFSDPHLFDKTLGFYIMP